jgi:hypothetical protein
LPEGRAAVFAQADAFREAQALFDRLAQILDQIARSAAGAVYRQELIRTSQQGQPGFACPALQAARHQLVAAEPYCGYCPSCYPARSARVQAACKKCGGRGWTTRAAFESCAASDRQQLVTRRTSA